MVDFIPSFIPDFLKTLDYCPLEVIVQVLKEFNLVDNVAELEKEEFFLDGWG